MVPVCHPINFVLPHNKPTSCVYVLFCLFQITRLLLVQALSLVLFCILQFLNEMIIGSLVLSFIIAALIDIRLQVRKGGPREEEKERKQ